MKTNKPCRLFAFFYFCVIFITVNIFLTYWSLLLAIIPIVYLILTKPKRWYLIIACGLLGVGAVLVIYHFVGTYGVFSHLSTWIEKLIHVNLRQTIVNYVNNGYDIRTASFINMILFNVKTTVIYPVYNHMIDLSVVYLIVVSGFHIAILKKLINWIFYKHRKIANIINLVVIIFYSYLLNFATSILRVLLMHIVTLFSYKRKVSNIDRVCIPGIFTILVCPSCCLSYGFCMSYFCTIVIIYLVSLNIVNKLIMQILINSCCVLITLPYVILMNGKISIFAVINGFVFSYLFAVIFVWCLLTFWIIWIAPLQAAIVWLVIQIVNGFFLFNTTVIINNFNGWKIICYQIICSLLIYNLKWL